MAATAQTELSGTGSEGRLSYPWRTSKSRFGREQYCPHSSHDRRADCHNRCHLSTDAVPRAFSKTSSADRFSRLPLVTIEQIPRLYVPGLGAATGVADLSQLKRRLNWSSPIRASSDPCCTNPSTRSLIRDIRFSIQKYALIRAIERECRYLNIKSLTALTLHLVSPAHHP